MPVLPMVAAERQKIDSSKTMAVEEFVSYIDTWSAMNTWRKKDTSAASAALAKMRQEYVYRIHIIQSILTCTACFVFGPTPKSH